VLSKKDAKRVKRRAEKLEQSGREQTGRRRKGERNRRAEGGKTSQPNRATRQVEAGMRRVTLHGLEAVAPETSPRMSTRRILLERAAADFEQFKRAWLTLGEGYGARFPLALDAIEVHAFAPLEASMRVTNSILVPLERPLPLTVTDDIPLGCSRSYRLTL
jgi:hypothetical protein